MKYYNILMLLMLTSFIGRAQSASYFTITGKITGAPDGWVFLKTNDGSKDKGDSTLIKDGVFAYKGNLNDVAFYSLGIGEKNLTMLPVTVNDKINISGDFEKFEDLKIEGAKNYAAYQDWSKVWSVIRQRAGNIYKKIESTTGADKEAAKAELKSLDGVLADSVTRFLKRNPNSPVSAWVITSRFIDYPYPNEASASYALLSEDAKNSTFGKELSVSVAKNSKSSIGSKPEFEIADVDGKMVRLSAFKGKYVLVDFWASWCGPCRAENPNLVKAYAKYKSKGFDILAISLDDKKDRWLKAVAEDNMPWIQTSDLKAWKSALVEGFGIKSIPFNFLVDPTGKIVAKDLRGEKLEKTLASLIN